MIQSMTKHRNTGERQSGSQLHKFGTRLIPQCTLQGNWITLKSCINHFCMCNYVYYSCMFVVRALLKSSIFILSSLPLKKKLKKKTVSSFSWLVSNSLFEVEIQFNRQVNGIPCAVTQCASILYVEWNLESLLEIWNVYEILVGFEILPTILADVDPSPQGPNIKRRT